jgi:uncharacterized protein (TIGR00297 family)
VFGGATGRALAGLLVATAIAVAARRLHALSPSGALAAVAVGTASLAAGWGWGVLLIAFFVSSIALSRFRAAAKARRTAAVVEKGGERDAVQVLANGGLFAVGALASLASPWPGWPVLALGALATAAADTWATEVGTLAAGPPCSIRSFRPVTPGTSGGVTLLGTGAALAGAASVALLAGALGWGPGVAAAAAAGGFAGAMADSLLGATVQARRWCDRCALATERSTHDCGERTRAAGGLRWLDNDGVNVASALVGGLAALAVAP